MLSGDVKHPGYGALAAVTSPLLGVNAPSSDGRDSKVIELKPILPSVVVAPTSTATAIPGEKMADKMFANRSPPNLTVDGAPSGYNKFTNYWLVLLALCFNKSTHRLTINVPTAADLTRALPFALILNQSIRELSIRISLNLEKVSQEVQQLQALTCKRNKESKSVTEEPTYAANNKIRAAGFVLEFAWYHMELALYDNYKRNNRDQRLIVDKLLQDLNRSKKAIKMALATGNKEILPLVGILRDRLNSFAQQNPTEEYSKLIANLDQTIQAEFHPIANGNKAALHRERAKDVGQGIGCCIFWVVHKVVTACECLNDCVCRGCAGTKDNHPFVSDWCNESDTPPKGSVYPLCCGVIPCCCCAPGKHVDMAIASFKENGEILAAMDGLVSAAAAPPQPKMV